MMKMTEQKKPKTEENKNTIVHRIKEHPLFFEIALFVVIAIIIGSLAIWFNLQSRIYIEKAEIYAPTISLAPITPGILEKVYVAPGDNVGKHKVVALIGGNQLKTESDGIIISVQDTPGQLVSGQTPIVQMINPEELRVIGHLDEDKGLSDVVIGQKVVFTADAFGSKEYVGYVDEISPSAREGDIVFSISDKRQIKQFDIKAKFDVDKYPELKNGMSAKMWIYK